MEEHKKINLEFYNQNASAYNTHDIFKRDNRNHLKKIHKISELLDINAGDRILEIGCGTGIHAKAMVENCDLRYFGVDISLGMINETKKRIGGGANLMVCDAEYLPYRDESFDGAYFCSSLHHMPEPGSVIKDVARVLKKGAKLVLMEPNKYCIKNYMEARLRPVEKNVLLMKSVNFTKWMDASSLEITEMSYFIHTPPLPACLSGLYDIIDEVARRIPIVNALSIMLYCVAVKK